MRKSNIFLLAYIIFLFICSFICKNDYINKISLAATFASAFFAISDMFLSPIKHFEKNIKRILKSNESLGEILNSHKKEVEQDKYFPQSLESYEHTKQTVLELDKSLKRYSIYGNIFFGLGVFIFLFILAFYNDDYIIFQNITKYQNQITIFAFAVVVLNYFIDDVIYKKYNTIFESINNIVEEI